MTAFKNRARNSVELPTILTGLKDGWETVERRLSTSLGLAISVFSTKLLTISSTSTKIPATASRTMSWLLFRYATGRLRCLPVVLSKRFNWWMRVMSSCAPIHRLSVKGACRWLSLTLWTVWRLFEGFWQARRKKRSGSSTVEIATVLGNRVLRIYIVLVVWRFLWLMRIALGDRKRAVSWWLESGCWWGELVGSSTKGRMLYAYWLVC